MIKVSFITYRWYWLEWESRWTKEWIWLQRNHKKLEWRQISYKVWQRDLIVHSGAKNKLCSSYEKCQNFSVRQKPPPMRLSRSEAWLIESVVLTPANSNIPGKTIYLFKKGNPFFKSTPVRFSIGPRYTLRYLQALRIRCHKPPLLCDLESNLFKSCLKIILALILRSSHTLSFYFSSWKK